jgi:hypothetical protein
MACQRIQRGQWYCLRQSLLWAFVPGWLDNAKLSPCHFFVAGSGMLVLFDGETGLQHNGRLKGLRMERAIKDELTKVNIDDLPAILTD